MNGERRSDVEEIVRLNHEIIVAARTRLPWKGIIQCLTAKPVKVQKSSVGLHVHPGHRTSIDKASLSDAIFEETTLGYTSIHPCFRVLPNTSRLGRTLSNPSAVA